MLKYNLPCSRMKDAMTQGGIREICTKAAELEAKGKKIIHLEIGRPDYDSPACAKNAVIKALSEGAVHYTENAGILGLRRAIAENRKKLYGMEIDAGNEVIVTSGATEALATVFLTLLEPGDEVIVPTPFFPAYATQIALADGVLREVDCLFEDGFGLDIKALEAAVTAKTKMILINSPNNPTGKTLTLPELQAVADIAKKHELWVFSDECYERFLYEGEPLSISCLEGMKERTIVVSAASKTFSMTGWRIGWLVLPKLLRPYADKCHQNLTTCATSFAQYGVAEALRSAESDVKLMIDGYRERRDIFIDGLRKIDGFEVLKPEGAFYAFVSIKKLTSKLGITPLQLSYRILEDAGVAVVPGDTFHAKGDFLRMAFCRPSEELREATERMKLAISRL